MLPLAGGRARRRLSRLRRGRPESALSREVQYYSGFHFDPQLASRAAGAPPARGTRGAFGGTGNIVTRNRQDQFSEFNNIILLQSQGNGGLDKGEEGQENYFSKNK